MCRVFLNGRTVNIHAASTLPPSLRIFFVLSMEKPKMEIIFLENSPLRVRENFHLFLSIWTAKSFIPPWTPKLSVFLPYVRSLKSEEKLQFAIKNRQFNYKC